MSDPLAAIIATLDDHTLEGLRYKTSVIECSCGWTGRPPIPLDDVDSRAASDLWRTHRARQVLAAIRAEDG